MARHHRSLRLSQASETVKAGPLDIAQAGIEDANEAFAVGLVALHPGLQHVDLAAGHVGIKAVFYQPTDRQ